MQDLLSAGVHFGHQTRRGNPKMREYIYGARDGVHIINLEHSEKLLKEAADFAFKLGQEGKMLLFVGTKKQAQSLIKEAAESAEAPFINYKWVGGFLTNFDEIRRNIKKMTDLKEKKQKGELSRYTKKEQLLMTRKMEKFDREMGGIVHLDKMPDALFIMDCVTERISLLEANRMGLPVIAVTDSNSDPSQVTYPIPGNDDATKAIKIMVDTIAKAYGEGKGKVSKKKETKEGATEDTSEESIEVAVPEVEALEEVVEKETVKDFEREV
jgi:small subunit ribosomal protein S2